MATRLAATLIALALASLAISIFVGVREGSRLGREVVDEQVVALRGSAVVDTENYANALISSATALAESPMASTALSEFSSAYRELQSLDPATLEDEREEVLEERRATHFEPLAASIDPDISLRDVVSLEPESIYLQYHYALTGDLVEPIGLDQANDGSTWSDVHMKIHPIYREIVAQQELSDLLLVEPDNASIVYSARKRPDLGTSLRTGPFSGTTLASVVNRVLDDPSVGAQMGDLSFYDPALVEPVGVVVAPVMDGSRLAGVLVLEFDSAEIDSALTGNGGWEAFPDTAQTYLAAADLTQRSIDRAYVVEPEAYLDNLIESRQIDESQRAVIEASGTTALTVVVDQTTEEAIKEGATDIRSGDNNLGARTIRAVFNLDIEGVDWSVVSEVYTKPAEQNLRDFRRDLIVGAVIFILSVAFIAVRWARGLMSPIRSISDRLGAADLSGTESIDLSARTPVEFRELAERFESMSDALRSQQEAISHARVERLALLREMLPSNVAPRIESGDIHELEQIPDATVAVLTIAGLGGLVSEGSESAARATVERLHAELDALAGEHGIERVKIVGDAYFAACGHDRPYLDHTQRGVLFTLEAREAIRRIGTRTDAELDLAAGVGSGPVTVGLTGGSRLLYDVWGDTVTDAHLLARGARSGQILVTGTVHGRLPDGVIAESADSDAEATVWTIRHTIAEEPS